MLTRNELVDSLKTRDFCGLGSLGPLIEVLSRFEDLIDMVLGPKTQPFHTVHQ